MIQNDRARSPRDAQFTVINTHDITPVLVTEVMFDRVGLAQPHE